MSRYFLAQNITAAQTGPLQSGSQAVQPDTQTNPNTPSPTQAFQLDVSGIGTVSATAQLLGSNDETNFNAGNSMSWVTLGQITANGTNTASAAFGGEVPFEFLTAYVSAISGTKAKATVSMSA
jgi:hypothetical protein